jgi:hypothetical protein
MATDYSVPNPSPLYPFSTCCCFCDVKKVIMQDKKDFHNPLGSLYVIHHSDKILKG